MMLPFLYLDLDMNWRKWHAGDDHENQYPDVRLRDSGPPALGLPSKWRGSLYPRGGRRGSGARSGYVWVRLGTSGYAVLFCGLDAYGRTFSLVFPPVPHRLRNVPPRDAASILRKKRYFNRTRLARARYMHMYTRPSPRSSMQPVQHTATRTHYPIQCAHAALSAEERAGAVHRRAKEAKLLCSHAINHTTPPTPRAHHSSSLSLAK
jgi:hypothetical protein